MLHIHPVFIIFALLVSTALLAAVLYLFWKIRKQKVIQSLYSAAEQICMEANDALFVINIVNGQILRGNLAAGYMLGYAPEQLGKMSIHDIFPEEYVARSSELIADVWEKGGLVFEEIPLLTSSGEKIQVECSGKVLPIGEVSAIVIYARDIRDRLRMQNQILAQKETIEEKNREITASIRYALRIQQAVLPDEEKAKSILGDHVVFYRPRDIVSGDFYVIESLRDGRILVAAGDCTGHGVPGAFMSMLGNSFLKQAMEDFDSPSAADILRRLDELVTTALSYRRKEGFYIRDGMDISICLLNPAESSIQFAGAQNPLFVVEGGKGKEIKGDKRYIGEWNKETMYTNHSLVLKKGSYLYLWSDGYADQFGGPNNKKFKYSRLKELLVSLNNQSMQQVGKILEQKFDEWKENEEQVDDVLVIGVKV